MKREKPKLRHATSARQLARRKLERAKWRNQFRPTVDHFGKKIARVQGRPVPSKRQAKRDYLAEAQKVNPAIRTIGGAKKLEQRLTREAKAGAR